ncbi:MAG TPA: LCP family protein, partial [Patescibacteria group bacterium]
KYVRSRETTSDFDRARRQQEVLKGIKDKAISAQVLTNPKKITDLITVLGRHILSDFTVSEGEQLLAIAHDFDNPTIRSQVLDTSEGGLLTSTRNDAGSYILVPKAGLNDYSEIQAFIKAYFNAPAINAEKPTITIQNGGITKDQFTRTAKYLEGAGFAVTKNTTSSEAVAKTTLHDFSSKKPISQKFLKDWLDLAPRSEVAPTPTTDFVLILGTDFKKVVQAAEKQTVKSENSTTSPLKVSPSPMPDDSLTFGDGGYSRTSSTTLIP